MKPHLNYYLCLCLSANQPSLTLKKQLQLHSPLCSLLLAGKQATSLFTHAPLRIEVSQPKQEKGESEKMRAHCLRRSFARLPCRSAAERTPPPPPPLLLLGVLSALIRGSIVSSQESNGQTGMPSSLRCYVYTAAYSCFLARFFSPAKLLRFCLDWKSNVGLL